MAHFAILDEKNNVIDVIVVSNESMLDSNGNENETIGKNNIIETLKTFYPNIKDSQLVQTSINNNIRKRYAGIGFSYDRELDAFIEPRPYSSWTLNKTTLNWEPPIPYPGTEKNPYQWIEKDQKWVSYESLMSSESLTSEN